MSTTRPIRCPAQPRPRRPPPSLSRRQPSPQAPNRNSARRTHQMRLKLIFSLAALLTLSAAAMAQQPAAVAGARTQPFLPKGKVALVNTAVFQEKVGEFRAKIDALNKQFEPRVKEVQQLADKITALETTLKSQ